MGPTGLPYPHVRRVGQTKWGRTPSPGQTELGGDSPPLGRNPGGLGPLGGGGLGGGVLLHLPIRIGVGEGLLPPFLSWWRRFGKGGVLLGLLPIRVGEGEGLLPPFLGAAAQGEGLPLPQASLPFGLLYKHPNPHGLRYNKTQQLLRANLSLSSRSHVLRIRRL